MCDDEIHARVRARCRHLIEGPMTAKAAPSKLPSLYESLARPLDLQHPEKWTIEDVVRWLKDISLEECVDSFRSRVPTVGSIGDGDGD